MGGLSLQVNHPCLLQVCMRLMFFFQLIEEEEDTYAFLYFAREDEALRAVKTMNKYVICDQEITVKMMKSKSTKVAQVSFVRSTDRR